MYLETISDEQLTNFLRDSQKEEKAFREIYDKYWQKLTSLAIYKTQSTEVATEIVQEIFIKLWENRKSSSISHLESYLFTALKYQIISHLRRVISDRKITDHYNEPTTDSQESLTAEHLKTLIDQAIGQLSEKTQQIFSMSRYEEKSHKEISSALDISEKTVEYHITQSLKHLKTYLKDYLPLVILVFFLE